MNTQSSPSTPDTQSPIPDSSPKPPLHRKIAKLPKPLRDRINSMLDDGLAAREIIANLQASDTPLPYPISEQNISDWRNGGYQEYLRHQDWCDHLHLLRESGSDLTGLTDDHQFQEILIQLGLTEIFRVLKSGALKPDSPNFIRLFNALARLNREALGLRKYNDLRADKAAAESRATRTPGVVEAQNGIFRAFDEAMNLKPFPHPIGPDLNVLLGLDPPTRSSRGNEAQISPPQSPSSSRGNEAHSPPQPKGLSEGSRGSQSAETPGNVPANPPHPEGMPDATGSQPSTSPADGSTLDVQSSMFDVRLPAAQPLVAPKSDEGGSTPSVPLTDSLTDSLTNSPEVTLPPPPPPQSGDAPPALAA